MKRLLSLLLILPCLLSGCFMNRRPVYLSKSCYEFGLEVLYATDDYLNGKTTAVVAAGKVQDVCRFLSNIPEEAGTQNQLVRNYCEMLGYALMLVADGDQYNEKEIINTRNYLAELLGEPRLIK